MTSDPDFKVTTFFEVKYRKGRIKDNCTRAVQNARKPTSTVLLLRYVNVGAVTQCCLLLWFVMIVNRRLAGGEPNVCKCV